MRNCKLLLGVFAILSCFCASANADPMLYNIYGGIRSAASDTFEYFTGSFIMSDGRLVDVTMFGDTGYSRTIFEIESFSLCSTNYSLTQTAGGSIMAWANIPSATVGIDTSFNLQTSGGKADLPWMHSPFQWNGGFLDQSFILEQPSSILIGWVFSFYNESPYNINYRIENFTAVRSHSVPEPTTLLLLGAGVVALAGYGRKKRN